MVILAAILAGINGTVARLLIHAGLNYSQLTLFRSVGAFIGLSIACILTDIRRLKVTSHEFPSLFIFGLVGFFGVPILYLLAITHLPVGIGVTLEYTAPVFVVLWVRYARRRRVRRRLWLGLVLCLCGLSAVANIRSHARLDYLGICFALGAAACLAVFYLAGERQSLKRDTMSLTCWSFGIASVACAVIQPVWKFPFHVLTGNSSNVPNWALCIYVVALGSILPYLLLARSLRYLGATSVGIISLAEPVTALIIAWLALNERLSVLQISGVLLILAGVILSETARTSDSG